MLPTLRLLRGRVSAGFCLFWRFAWTGVRRKMRAKVQQKISETDAEILQDFIKNASTIDQNGGRERTQAFLECRIAKSGVRAISFVSIRAPLG